MIFSISFIMIPFWHLVMLGFPDQLSLTFLCWGQGPEGMGKGPTHLDMLKWGSVCSNFEALMAYERDLPDESQRIWAQTIADTNKVSFRAQKAYSYDLRQTISYTSIFTLKTHSFFQSVPKLRESRICFTNDGHILPAGDVICWT